jgi:hypothetical protein
MNSSPLFAPRALASNSQESLALSRKYCTTFRLLVGDQAGTRGGQRVHGIHVLSVHGQLEILEEHPVSARRGRPVRGVGQILGEWKAR